MEKVDMWKSTMYGSQLTMCEFLITLNRSVKPIVGLVRGKAVGIGFTLTSLFDFIYCTPETEFSTPFMASAQSPEGSSTMTFPMQFGIRRANEILLLDKPITAQEAKLSGYVNDIIEDLNSDYFPDLDKIPAVKKLVATDYRTLVNCKQLINKAKDNDKIEAVIHDEARKLVASWLDDEFPPKLMMYMQSLREKREGKKRAKL